MLESKRLDVGIICFGLPMKAVVEYISEQFAPESTFYVANFFYVTLVRSEWANRSLD